MARVNLQTMQKNLLVGYKNPNHPWSNLNLLFLDLEIGNMSITIKLENLQTIFWKSKMLLDAISMMKEMPIVH